MTTMIEKKVDFLGNDVQISIPSRMDFLLFNEDYFGNFGLGGNLVLRVHVRRTGHLESSYVTTGIHTKDGVAISKYDSNLVSKGDLYDKLLSEIDGTVANIRRDVAISYNEAIKLTESLNDVFKHILSEKTWKTEGQFQIS